LNAGTPSCRDACADDLPALLALEAGFPGDRLSPRQFRYHLRRPGARLRVVEDIDGTLLGYGLLLHRADSAFARLYSIVVAPAARGRGIGSRLLGDIEQRARDQGALGLRLEVREDNTDALALYRTRGYQPFSRRPDYYEDGAAALRLQRGFASP
jgi:[ribosomal protein S18]-alanine N-acetyltransferase